MLTLVPGLTPSAGKPAFPVAVFRLALALAILAVSGCRCQGGTVENRLGELNFVFEQGGVTVTAPAGEFDFGKVAMGVKKPLKIVLQNRGDGPIELVGVEKLEGAAVKLGEAPGENAPVFTLAFAPQRLGVGGTLELDGVFDAPVEADPMVRTRDYSVRLLVRVDNATAETGELTLRGTAVSGQCNLPDTVDFGAVAIQDTFKRGFIIENNSPLPATANVGVITSSSGDDRAFTFAAESVKGDVYIDMGLKKDVVLQFTPTEARDYVAFVKVRAAEQCPDVSVKLIGSGVSQVVNCTPNPLDFGYVTPGLQTQAELTLSNSSLLPVTITGMQARAGTAASPDFKLLGADMITLPPAMRVTQPDGSKSLVSGTAKVQVTFKPTLLGPRQGNLFGVTALAKQPELGCPLKGAGGGPDIDVKPGSSLNVGKIPFFSTAPKPFFVTRKVTLQNVGTLPNPPDPRANLHLGARMPGGTSMRPYWKVTPKNAQTLESEICVGEYDEAVTAQPCRDNLPLSGAGRYDPQVGIVASTATSLLDIPIRITPAAPNKMLEWDVTFYSNDPDEPEVTVTIKGESVVLPPCQFQVSPTTLNFGIVTPPAYRDLSFAIKNIGADVCLLTHLDIRPGSDPLYSLPNGPLYQVTMMAGQTLNVLVRAAPMGSVGSVVQTALGAVQFGISDPLRPQNDVDLTTSVATSCLTIAPDDLDFGTVEKDCSSARRTFSIYNTCSTPVTVNSWTMVAPAGVPGGSSPACPGAPSTNCPEFLIDGSPSFTMGTQLQPGAAMPATFALKYHPLDFGADTGAFLLKVTQVGQVVDYIVTLRGVGDAIGRNIDTFRQDARPKADILLVIDNSCSMADKQTALSQNFASFIAYATRVNVDYQIGVITTDLGSNTLGELIGSAAGTSPKILKPSTPMVEAEFTSRVKVGIMGGLEGMAEPAVKALSAPLITNQNAGFLRQDAVLAVVIISDAGDQSPLAATVYENQLRNVKGAQRPNLFSYNQIGPFAAAPATGCSYDDFTDVSKNLYLIQRLNGVKAEICTNNWGTTLEDIGKTAFGYRTNFFLTAEPDLTNGNTITVKINGVPIASTDTLGATVWTYDSVSNSVNFAPLYVPEPGNTLTVEYFVACN